MEEVVNAIVIDNDSADIIGISTALATAGISSLPVHFRDPTVALQHCQNAAVASPRIIITDIQMQDGGQKPSKTDLANVANCLAQIVERTEGPYIILAWTSKPEALNDLQSVVLKYFETQVLRPPTYFSGISKNNCKTEAGYDAKLILESFAKHLDDQAELRALLHWERRVLHAANRTVNALIDIPNTGIAATLSALANAVAGKNVVGNEAIAVNEAISLILRDEISQNTLKSASSDVWAKAVKPSTMKLPETGKHALNSLLHIDCSPNQDTICPGDVWKCSGWEPMFERFAFPSETAEKINAFKSSFIRKSDSFADLEQKVEKGGTPAQLADWSGKLVPMQANYTAAIDSLDLIVMEISPACDFSNNKKSLKSVVMGVLISADRLSTTGVLQVKSTDVIVNKIRYKNDDLILCFSAKYVTSLSSEVLGFSNGKMGPEKIFRVRESLLNSIIQAVSFYNSRIGTVSFH